jgi:hypothetical protein
MSCDGAHVSGAHADVITHAILSVCVCVCVCVCVERARERDRETEIRDRESVSAREGGERETYACISRTARISLIIQLPAGRQVNKGSGQASQLLLYLAGLDETY